MKKLLVVEMENGLKWYVMSNGALTVNATYDDVTQDNYNEVSDVDCFTMQNTIKTIEELENEVFEFVGNSILWDEVYKAIDKENEIFNVDKIVRKIENQCMYRENRILSHFESIEIEGNLLHIYDTDGNGFSVGYCIERLGDIVA